MIFAEYVQGGINQMGTNRSALTLPVGNVDLGHQEVKQAAQTLLGRGEGGRAVIWRPPRRLSRADNERAGIGRPLLHFPCCAALTPSVRRPSETQTNFDSA